MRLLARGYFVFAYFFSLLLFGLFGLALNLICALLLVLPRHTRFGPAARRAIRALFSAWVKWLHFCGAIRVTWRGFDAPLPAGVIYTANHPTLIDATLLLARLPNAICIFKPALLRNPAIAASARLAGYIAGDAGIDLIHDAADRVLHGCSLLIFPEGTRTNVGSLLNPLKPGFALVAERAAAPIQIITIRTAQHLVPKGWPWWRVPRLPGRVEINLGERILPTGRSASELSTAVENRLRAALADR
ncbi:MAG: 1-acyl-sn-glycerol-3-phosphate acyltransferase [Verrucomicrobiota bacterium]|nr:1-acyl-sn-glycerol-3-phosphate acyltransferase [Verrucomicrobiota bacterium]